MTAQARAGSHWTLALAAAGGLAAAACTPHATPAGPAPQPAEAAPAPPPPHTLVPLPAQVSMLPADSFVLTSATRIVVDPGAAEAARIGEYLAAILRPSTAYPLPVAAEAGAPAGAIALRLVADSSHGDEGYELRVGAAGVTLTAHRPAGLFRGVQTLRQLLPPGVEAQMNHDARAVWAVPGAAITDRPRFAWRGSMLDVARHFFTVDEVKQFIDGLALYKINVLHLHLADDQGWRIQIDSRPRLTEVGGLTQVGGGPGGFYTKDQYREIVQYAAERYITVVPEIDLPGHTNAALVAYPEFSCGSRPPVPYTGTEVGFSAVCVNNEGTYRFLDDILRELAALTPGPYLHVGGDEVHTMAHDDYVRFMERIQEMVRGYGKQAVGWEEIAKARLHPTTLVQQWKSDSAVAAVRQGNRLILSPANRAYVDMKYTPQTELGLTWAAIIELRDAYDWEPATLLDGVGERDIIGVEAPLWSETVQNLTAAQYLVFPRLPAIAEIGWSPAAARGWEGFRQRIAGHAPRWRYLGINYYPSPQVDW